MKKTYDVIIVGAGPGGLMAAKVAGENGLKVALLDRKEKIVEIGRCCATMFAVESDYYFGERMYFNEKNGRFVFPVTGFSLKYDGPYHNFYGWHVYTSDAKHYIKLGDYDENVKKGDQGRLSVTYSKSHLLKSLLNDAKESGVDVFPETNVVDVRCKGKINEVVTSEGNVFEGVFTIAADGINSRLAKILNLNRERRFYGTMQGVSYYMSGLDLPHPEVLVMGMTAQRIYHTFFFWVMPSLLIVGIPINQYLLRKENRISHTVKVFFLCIGCYMLTLGLLDPIVCHFIWDQWDIFGEWNMGTGQMFAVGWIIHYILWGMAWFAGIRWVNLIKKRYSKIK